MRTQFLVTLMMLVGSFLVAGSLSAQAQQVTPAPYLGVRVQANDAGALVVQVMPNSPAADAGVLADDVITAVNGQDVTAADLPDAVAGFAVGDTITLDLERNNETLSVDATLQARPVDSDNGLQMRTAPLVNRPYLGITLRASDAGVVVDRVVAGSPAEQAGLMTGDVITAINDTPVTQPADLVTAVQGMNAGDTVTLSLTRDGKSMDLDVTLAAPQFLRRGFGTNMNRDIVIYDGTNWRVMALSDNSPLADAGLQSGDLITAIDGESRDPVALQSYLADLANDATVTLSVTRSGDSMDISVNATDLQDFIQPGFGFDFDGQGNMGPFNFQFNPFGKGTWLGVEIINLNADVAAAHNLDVTDGALVTSVVDNSPAADAGLQVDDVITAVDGDAVDVQHTLSERLYAYDPGDSVTLAVLRGGETINVDVTLGNLADQMGMGMMPHFFGPNGRGFGNQGNNGRGPRFFFGTPNNGNQNPANPPVPETTPASQANI